MCDSHLFQIWPEEKSAELGNWFIWKCCKSVHLALKIVWWVSASAHFTTPERKVKCLKLVDDCEMSLVNAEIINENLSPRISRNRANSRSRLRRILPKTIPDNQPASSSISSSSPSSNSSVPEEGNGTGEEERKDAQEEDSESGRKMGGRVSPLPHLRVSVESEGEEEKECSQVRSPSSTTSIPTLSTPTALAEQAIRDKLSSGLDFKQLDPTEQHQLLMSMREKRLRSEYFNAHLSLITLLDHASAALAKIPRKGGQRQAQLSKFVASLNQSRIKGLYFPGMGANDPHYRILRILESKCLNSRDKAPFILNLEIVGTGRRSGDPNIYRSYSAQVPGLPPLPILPLALPPEIPPEAYSEEEVQEPPQEIPPSSESGSTDSSAREAPSADAPAPGDVAVDSSQPTGTEGRVVSMEIVSAEDEGSEQEDGEGSEQEESPSTTAQSFSLVREPSPHSTTSAPPTPSSAQLARPQRWATLPVSRPEPESPVNKDYTLNKGDKLAQQEIAQVFGHPWHATVHNFALLSPDSHLPNWDMLSVIYKAGDDCRQEALAMQLINVFHDAFTRAQLPLRLRPYFTLVTSHSSGVIETVPDTMSVDGIKRKLGGKARLNEFIQRAFGKTEAMLARAKRNFTESMAGYSIVTYLLQIKDRHNGNILLDSEGNLIHVDFGFMLSNTPGNVHFETAPFKLSREYIEVMDGESSALFSYFKLLVVKGFLEIRKYAQQLILLVEIMSHGSQMPCFQGASAETVVKNFRDRFMLHLPQADCMRHVMSLIELSCNNWRTTQYDNYQRLTNGIL